MEPTMTERGSSTFKVPRMIDDIGEGGSVEAYMNPYIDNVLNKTMSRIRDATNLAKQWQSNMGAHAAGAFGDARHGVSDVGIEKAGIREMGDAAATGYAAAYDSAQGMRDADINRLFRTEEFNRQGTDDLMQYIDSLFRSGSNEQALEQSGMDLGYQDFLRQLNWPIEQYNLLAAALSGSPYGQSSTNTTKSPGPSTAASIAGGLGSVLAAYLGE